MYAHNVADTFLRHKVCYEIQAGGKKATEPQRASPSNAPGPPWMHNPPSTASELVRQFVDLNKL